MGRVLQGSWASMLSPSEAALLWLMGVDGTSHLPRGPYSDRSFRASVLVLDRAIPTLKP